MENNRPPELDRLLYNRCDPVLAFRRKVIKILLVLMIVSICAWFVGMIIGNAAYGQDVELKVAFMQKISTTFLVLGIALVGACFYSGENRRRIGTIIRNAAYGQDVEPPPPINADGILDTINHEEEIMATYESTLTKQAKTRRLMINFNTCEVRCPLHKKDVDVLTVCMESPSGNSCRYYSRMDTMSGLHCKWTADSDE